MIISAFPMERVKKEFNKTKAVVIGGGDVVENRLYPALQSAERKLKQITVMDLESHTKRLPYAIYSENEDKLTDLLSEQVDDNTIVWIETPTNTHLSYLERLLKSRASLIVLEKPICSREKDLAAVEKIIADSERRSKIFFLSYYVLEKALPVNMLFSYNECYQKYLDIEDEYLARNWRMFIGALVEAQVVIHEGSDTRAWVIEDSEGQLYETFLHNVLVASLICGRCSAWENPILSVAKDEGGASSVTLSASLMGAKIALSQKKGLPPELCKRYARFTFSDGVIDANLETQSATLRFDKLNKTVTVSVKDIYRQKYAIMADLAARVHDEELSSADVDGLENQIQSIRWISELSERKDVAKSELVSAPF